MIEKYFGKLVQEDNKTMIAVNNVNKLRQMGYEVEFDYEEGYFFVILTDFNVGGLSYKNHVSFLMLEESVELIVRTINKMVIERFLNE